MGILSNKNKLKNSVCQNILIGGEAGEGIKSAGKILALALIKNNYSVYVYDEYPSLIRGGHNIVAVTYSRYPVYFINKEIDILLCLDRDTFDKNKNKLNEGSIVIYDREDFTISEDDQRENPFELIELPVKQILSRNNLPKITQNIIYISAALAVAGIDKEKIYEVIIKELGNKKKFLPDNLKASELGFESVIEYFDIKKFKEDKSFSSLNSHISKDLELPKKYLLTGNDAIGIGAIKSRLHFYAAYPMTPASTILDFMFHNYKNHNIVVKQTEDEIAAINMAIGAAYAGARSMVGTSGGGFSLMVEGLGLAAITEVPIVIVLSQRPGPATGMPTWTGQADLLFTIHASRDEFPRIILTPTDTEECYYLSFLALNLAEKYQLPVFIMVDKQLSESMHLVQFDETKTDKIDRGLLMNERILSRVTDFNRYEFTNTGISNRSIPGQLNGIYLANSDEGDTKGFTTEDDQLRKKKVEKRFRKILKMHEDLPELNYYGNPKSKIGIITWGSTKGSTLEAIRRLQGIGKHIKLLCLNYVEPFPASEVENFINTSEKICIIENNFSSQLSRLIKMYTGIEIPNKLTKYDGRPIFPDEIVEYLEQISQL